MNPFKYGTVVTGEYFYDRTEELKSIKNDIKSGNNLIIYAPRRYGKTSLIIKVLDELEKEGMNTIYIDFFKVHETRKFLELYSLKILEKKLFTTEGIIKQFRKFVKSIVPSVTFDDKGKTTFQVQIQNAQSSDTTFEEVINLPEKISGKDKWVVVFDEFQEINKLNGESFEKQLRASIQFHKNVNYVFMGSKNHLLMNMFRDKSRAFYNIGKTVKIEKIPAAEMSVYLESRFKKSRIKITKETIEYILEITENIPYYVQYTASELWQNKITKKGEISREDVIKAVNRVIESQMDYYLEIYSNLTSNQKSLLIALSKAGGNIFSKEYMVSNNLSTVSSTQRSVQRLVESEIIEKHIGDYTFTDPFFKKFIQLYIGA
jgi:hypothetical protein